ncbi:AAA family ATPase [Alcanivorax sp. 1008]|uniref:AAA family ATPase n=1 Tax=Alcanivorax sp. 1008 TaxID=2816853 RepID=UPI001DAC9833|nr:AAA family ATPase [Alcanivorax sp. 1008]MCC1496895.1 AAA family ATPase [Alcanivorax sp. 1008]
MDLATIHARAERMMSIIREAAMAPNSTKTFSRVFSRAEVAELVDRSPSRIAGIEKELVEQGALSPLITESNVRLRYGIQHVHELQKHFGTQPWRDSEIDEPLVLAITSLKGGVGKTTVALYTAQYLALKGYRVLLVDMDSQASTTSAFGIVPDMDLGVNDTILPFFEGEGGRESLHYAIKKTHIPGLDLIPTNLVAFNIEWSLAASILESRENPEKREELLSLLNHGLNSVKDDYDIVILDSPPNLGVTTMNILRSVDAMVIPSPARVIDFSSTVQFMTLLKTYAPKFGARREYKFLKMAITLYEGSRLSTQRWFGSEMINVFEDAIFKVPFVKMAEIENTASSLKTVFEDDRPQKKALAMVELFCKQIEAEMLGTWPSRQKESFRLRKELERHGLEAPEDRSVEGGAQ